MNVPAERPVLEPVVAVCTFRRPALLQQLLVALGAQHRSPTDERLPVVVVDNSPDGEARAVVAAAQSSLALDLSYVPHGAGNISSGRNEALRRARSHGDAVVLIDDDETPEPEWLSELLQAQSRSGADIVTGPVLASFPVHPPEWLLGHEDLYSVTGHEDGAWLTEAVTGNVLIRTSCLDATGVQFDEMLGRSGGEDQLFFRSARDRGATIVYAAHAVVHEPVPVERLALGYLLRREYRKGNTLGLLDRSRPGWPRGRPLRRFLSAGWWALSGLLQVVAHGARGRRAAAARGAMRVTRSAGMLVGLAGRNYDLYSTSPRTPS